MERQVFKSGGYLRLLCSFILTIIIVGLAYTAVQSLYVHLIWSIFITYSIGHFSNKVVIE